MLGVPCQNNLNHHAKRRKEFGLFLLIEVVHQLITSICGCCCLLIPPQEWVMVGVMILWIKSTSIKLAFVTQHYSD